MVNYSIWSGKISRQVEHREFEERKLNRDTDHYFLSQAIRSKHRPCLDVQKQMRSRQVLSSTMSYTKAIMTPAIFNEATVVRTSDSDAVSDINIGLIW